MSQPLIIAIGASSGGLPALIEFFEHSAADAGMAYIVLLQPSPGNEPHPAQALQQMTTMPLTEVATRTRIEAGRVYVIPADRHLSIDGGQLLPGGKIRPEERPAQLDRIFRSLADTFRNSVVAVILSGAGASGAGGLRHVKEQGGAVFVQNPREAEVNEMPRYAIASDLVDDVLNAAEIPARILAYRGTLAYTTAQEAREPGIGEDHPALQQILTQLRLGSGLDFSDYRRTGLKRRIAQRMASRGIGHLPDYAGLLEHDATEVEALLDALRVSRTDFFRDEEAFDIIGQDVLSAILRSGEAEGQLRIWVAGCATGEEAYSLAMLCAECRSGLTGAPAVLIFATDTDEGAIAAARDGFYTRDDAAGIAPGRLQRFFVREAEGFRVRREIREMILFARHDLLKDPPFSRIDLIACRNVMGDFDRALRLRLLETFYFALKPAGFLVLGSSENVEPLEELFEAYSPGHHIYRSQVLAGPRVVPMPEQAAPPAAQQPSAPAADPISNGGSGASCSELHLRLVEQYAPPSLMIDAAFEIVHQSPRAARYLSPHSSEATQALLTRIRHELRNELRNSIYEAFRTGMPVVSAALRLHTEAGPEDLRIHVRPFVGGAADYRGFMLIVFEPVAAGTGVTEPRNAAPETGRPEDELARLRAELRASNEQHEFQARLLRASNEELQAMNEELRSAAEELETSQEELQSINEELFAVNQELKERVEDSILATNNLRNLINSTDIGTIFLDRSFRIVLFTPAVRTVFNLIAADYGRPLSDITSRLRTNNLLDDAEAVIRDLRLIEREAETIDNRTLLVRLSPYRTERNRIQGVVISFVDITERKRSEEAIRSSEARLSRMVNVPSVGVLSFDHSGALLHANDAFLEMTGYVREEFDQQRFTWRDFTPAGHVQASEEKLREIIENGYGEPYEKEYLRKDGSRMWMMFVAADIGDGTLVEFAVDISDRKRAEDALVASEEKYRTLFETIDEGFCTIELSFDEQGNGHDYRVLDFNPAFVRHTGLTDLRGKSMRELAPELEEFWYRTYGEIAKTGIPARFEHEAAAFGRHFDVYAFRIGAQEPGPVAVLFNDISERKRTQQALQESEARLSVTMETAIDYAIITMDTNRLVEGWSRGAERTFEYTESEMLGESSDIIFTPEDRAAGAPQEEMETALEEGMALDERWHLRKDGSRFYMSGVLRPISNQDGITGYVKVARDMTAQKEAEESLRISEERYRNALQSAEMAAWDWDIPADTVIWNDQHFYVLGLEPDGRKTNRDFFLSFVHEHDRELVARALQNAVLETGIYQAEFRIVRADTGEHRWMSGYGSAVKRDADGRIVRMVGVMYDISRRKRVEEQKEEFIGIASHELKTPLASIKAYSEVLQEMFSEAGDDRSAKLMRKMEAQVDRLTNLVRALLDVTRIREGKLELEKEPFDLGTLVNELIDELQVTTRIQLRVIAMEPAVVLADRKTIGQVISNFLSNAIKYARGTEFVDVALHAGTGEVQLSVRDYGIGMSPDVSSRVFDRFFRALTAKGSTYPGLGLGLYISAEIVKLHGGRIWVESEEGQGSTFSFILPAR